MTAIDIVGGGIAGTALAYYLRDSGFDVTLLEKVSLGAGTTGKSIACFGWYPLYEGIEFELATRSWDLYEPLIEDGTLTYDQNGLLETATSNDAFEALTRSASALRSNGIPAEALEPDAVRDYHVNPEMASAGAVFYPTVGRLDPGEIVAHLAREAEAGGVTVLNGVEVTAVRTANGAVTGLETTDGSRHPDIVINAAGPWSQQLAEMAGLSLPVKHSYAPISVLDTAENFELPTVILDNGFYLSGEQSAKVLVGHAPHDSEEDLWTITSLLDDPGREQGTGLGSVDEAHRRRVAELAPRVVPALDDAELSNEWQGIRCHTPDGRPLLGPTAIDGFHLATGLSGWGITSGPACGQLLAEYLESETGSPLPETLLLDRFADE